MSSESGDLELEGACLESYCPPEFDSLDYTLWSEEELSNLSEEDLQWWKEFCGGGFHNVTQGKTIIFETIKKESYKI